MKNFLLFLCVGLSASCGSSKKATEAPITNSDEQKQYSLSYSDVMEFTRGVLGKFKIDGKFTGEKESTVTIDELPEGADFAANILTWQPSCDLKPENGQFIRGYMIHRLRISFKSKSSDGLVQKPALLIIHKDGEGSICVD
jgi:hypothetical protein